MSKNLNVNLTFKADSSQAKSQIIELQSLLNKVALGTNINVNPTQMREASAAAKELALHLNNAYNATTGNFDLSKLDRSLKTTKSNITDLSTKLVNAGATGQQAFVKLAQTIAAADRPMITLSARMKEFGVTLANTARWQISSSILHGMIGAVQEAYGYAQDLNESLNNIRIVTGQNIDQMSKFAAEANKAAKALSATTTDYTDAALIFYQQGLNDKEVAERAEATIKMANVSRQSAEIVSDQMTAIWNNFYDGSKSLEYYGDVITELGAATASSSEEIATGLEKFAAVADTVGLSYEYATAALATVTATTRQSADIVGTAFKTLFARIQDLELGETLDDGVTFGKYSEALNAVGISIMDQQGQLKDMNLILDDMGDKWGQLTKAQQVSLAQTVAGTRQYTQLVALMDNWSYFQENLQAAMTSEGALQEQADIYAESWEAAQKRVQASAEALYSDIIDDEFFIDITNGFSGLLDGIDAFVDGVGGIGPLVGGISSMLLGAFAYKVPEALNRLKHNFLVTFQGAQKQAAALANQMNQVTEKALQDNNFNQSTRTALENANALNIANNKTLIVSKNLTEQERQRYQQELSVMRMHQDEAQAIADKITERREHIQTLGQELDLEKAMDATGSQRDKEELQLIREKTRAQNDYNESMTGANLGALNNATQALANHRQGTEIAKQTQSEYVSLLHESYIGLMQETNGKIENSNATIDMTNTLANYTTQMEQLVQAPGFGDKKIQLQELRSQIEMVVGDSLPGLKDAFDKAMIAPNAKTLNKELNNIVQILKNAKIPASDLERILRQFGQGQNITKLKNEYKELDADLVKLTQKEKILNSLLSEFNPTHVVTGLERITSAAAGLGQVAMLAQSVRSIFQAWENDDLSVGEKLTTTFMSLSMIVPSLLGSIKSLNTAIFANANALNVQTAASAANNILSQVSNDLAGDKIANEIILGHLNEMMISDDKERLATHAAEVLVQKGLITEKQKETVITGLLKAVKDKENASRIVSIATKLAEKLTQLGLNAAMAQGLAILLVYSAALLAAGAIIAGIVIGIKALVDAYNADAIAAERAAKAADSLADASENAKSTVEELKSAFDGYNSAIETLDSLKEGMEGYEEAVKAVNDETLNLLEKYPDLAKMADIIEGKPGSYRLNQGAIDSYIAQAEKQADMAQAAALTSAARASRERVTSDQTNLRRELNNITVLNTVDYDDNGVIDNAYWQWIGAGNELADNFEAWASLSPEDFNEKVREYGKSIGLSEMAQESLVNSLADYQDDINTLATNTQEAANQMANVAKVMAGEVLGRSATDAQSDLYQETFTSAEETEYNAWLDKLTGSGINKWSGYNNAIIQEVAKKAANLGLDIDFARSNTVQGSDTNRAFAVLVDGETKIMTAEELASAIAAAEAQKQAEAAVREGTNTDKPEDSINTQLAQSGIVLNKDVSTDVANALLQRLQETDDDALIAAVLAGTTSASEQTALINELLQEQIKATDSINVKEASEKYDLEAESVEYYAESLMKSTKALKDNAKMAGNIAVANTRMNKGLVTLAENFADYEKTLNESKSTSAEYQEALKNISDAMSDILGLDDVELSRDFLTNTENLDLMAKAAQGDAKAVEQLRTAAAKDIIQNIELNDETFKDELITATNEFQLLLDQKHLTIGATFDNSKALESLNQLIQSSGMTAEQIQDYFNALGYTPELDYITDTQTTRHWGSVTDPISGEIKNYEWVDNADVQIPQVKSLTYHGNAGATINTSAIKNANESSGGGKSNKREQTKRDSGDRYKEIEDQLDDIAEAAEDVNRELDKMFGAGRLKEIEKLIKLQEKEIGQLERKKKSAEGYLERDKNDLSKAASAAGVTFTLENGNISNYNEQMDALYAKLNAKEQDLRNAQDAGKNTDALEEEVEYLEKLIENLEEAVGQYDETRELIEDIDDEIAEARDEILALNYQKITEKLEIQIELNDADLKRIERQIAALGDDLFARAEVATIMGGYGAEYEDALKAYESYGKELEAAYAAGEISQADYIEGLKAVQQGYWDNIDALREWKAEMKEYYADTLAAGNDEFQKYMDFMEHPTRVMEHYNSILDLTGGEKDYAAKQVVLEGIAQTRQDQAESRKAYYEMLQAEADKQRAEMEALDPSSEAYEYAKVEWEAAQELANQAQEDMLSAIEDWAQAVADVLDNELAAAADELEKALTNGSSFDELNTAMERTKSLQEEWLTTTNKIYETNKLMRTAQQALDKTTNQAAKSKLQAFIDQTQQLQDQEELSEYELKIQQARYDLLLAEIALEEAQNAKSTVRLQRDSEGNFGYVYTADQDSIAEAQQNYDDADNALYNLGLDGYNEYTEKYQQTMQEMYDTLTAITEAYRNGEYASEEEYHQAMLDAQNYYGEKLADYTYLAQAGMMAQSFEQFQEFKDGWNRKKDALDDEYKGKEYALYAELVGYAQGFNADLASENTIRQDGWATTFNNMKGEGQNWATAMDGYLTSINTAFTTYKTNTESVNTAVGLSMDETGSRADSLETQVRELKDESQLYKDLIVGPDGTGGLVKDLKDLYTETGNATLAFQAQLPHINNLETAYEQLALDIQDTINKLLSLDGTDVQTSHTHTETTIYETIGGDDGNTGGGNTGGGNTSGGTKPNLPNIKAGKFYYMKDGKEQGYWSTAYEAADAASRTGMSDTTAINLYATDGIHYMFYDTVASILEDYAQQQTGLFEDMVTLPTNFNSTETTPQTSKPGGGGGGGSLWNPLERIAMSDTGSYTGEWGPWAKLAWIHEKELILNAEDTENMLTAVSIVRDLMSMFDPGTLANLVSPFMDMNNFSTDALEQIVRIEANFPSVIDRYEIEEALSNLVNTASQFANRKHL